MLTAVSYTHLDVYKRQVQRGKKHVLRHDFGTGYQGKQGGFPGDVYKRQPVFPLFFPSYASSRSLVLKRLALKIVIASGF